MDRETNKWKKDFEDSTNFIQKLAMDYSWIEWGEGSMGISSVPKGWEKIIINLFKCLNAHAKFDRHVPKTDWKSRIWNTYCVVGRKLFIKFERLINPYRSYGKDGKWFTINPELRKKTEKTKRFKIYQALQTFRWNHFHQALERKFPETLYIEQIKQKIDLRIYTSGGDDIMRGMIQMAQYLALKTCEETGNAGGMCMRNGWCRTLSKVKAKELGYTLVKN